MARCQAFKLILIRCQLLAMTGTLRAGMTPDTSSKRNALSALSQDHTTNFYTALRHRVAHTPTHPHTHTHTPTQPDTHTTRHPHNPTPTQPDTHAPTQPHTHAHTPTHPHAHTYPHLHTHTPTDTHTHIPTRPHTHPHTHTRAATLHATGRPNKTRSHTRR